MKYKAALITLAVIISLAMLGLASKQLAKPDHVIEKLPLPNFYLNKLDSTQVTMYDFIGNHNGLIVGLINSECSICVEQVDELYKRAHKLGNIKVVLLSYQELNDIVAFSDQYPDAPFVFGQVELHVLDEHFGKVSTPKLFLYNRDNELIKGLNGVNRVVHLKKYVD